MSDDIRREEIRGLFTLGLMAILITLRFNLEPDATITVWEMKNFSIFPTIDFILITWGLYACFMVFGYSSDIFSSKICKIFKELGRASLVASTSVIFFLSFVFAVVNAEITLYGIIYIVLIYLGWKVYNKVKIAYKIKKNK